MNNKYPCDLGAEQAVLGSILIDSRSDRCQSALRKINSDMFYSKHHAVIFKEIKLLDNQQKPVDILTLNSALEDKGLINSVGGLAYLAELCKVPSAINIQAYTEIIKNKYLERATLKALGECQEIITSNSLMATQDKISEVQRIFTALDDSTTRSKNSGLVDINKIQIKWLSEVEQRYENPDKARGLTTGIHALDEKLNPKGIVKGSLFVIGARPKMGKTSLLIQMALNCAMKENKATAIFSLEMPADQLFERMITQVSGVSGDVFYNSDKDEDKFNLAFRSIQSIVDAGNLYIDDTPSINLSHIRSECRRLKRENGEIGMIFVDYLTLMTADKAERNDLAFGMITKGLKALAKELNCIVVLLTQLNRQLESRPDKRPHPSDSRDTGQIEQDCDYWVGLYRDRVYNEQADPFLTEIILRLNRHGETGTVYANMKYGQIFEINQAEALKKSEQSKSQTNSKKYKKDEDDF